MPAKILLVNPPIYDFSAYDFWLRPYGLLTVGGALRGRCELRLFDFLDRRHPLMAGNRRLRRDGLGRGAYLNEEVARPAVFADVPRRYRRFGLPRKCFREYLQRFGPFDFALVQTVMTYWYPGVREVVSELRRARADVKIGLGGPYATLCPAHAWGLGVDFVLEGCDLAGLWAWLGIEADPGQLPLWEAYADLATGALKLTDGCPFRCTYCCVPMVYGGCRARSVERAVAEAAMLRRLGATNVAFYDDALLYKADEVLGGFLDSVERWAGGMAFHTPNALHARYLSADLARRMVAAGFATFYLGFESASPAWQRSAGAKVGLEDLSQAVEHLRSAGARGERMIAYLLMGHPNHAAQELESSLRLVHELGIRVMLAEFSPIPGTPDGEACRRLVDMDEPLWHNKTVFAMTILGEDRVDGYKRLSRELNERL